MLLRNARFVLFVLEEHRKDQVAGSLLSLAFGPLQGCILMVGGGFNKCTIRTRGRRC